jgi:phosphoribosyl-AMP cyclohydrolase
MSVPNAFEAFLRKEIEEKGAKTRADRAALYSDFTKRIDARVGQHPDPLEQAQHRAHYQKLLDDAKAAIEADFLILSDEIHEKSFVDRAVEFGKRHWKWVSGAGAVASFASEFAKPLAEFTGLLAGGSTIGLIAALIMARKAKSETTNRACVSAAVVCGVFGLSSMAMLSVRAIYPDAQANGAVAKIVPGMEGLQQQVLGLDKKLGEVATNTAETARNTEQISETAWYSADPNQLWRRALASGNVAHLKRLKATGYVPDALEVSMIASEPLKDGLQKQETIKNLMLWQSQFDRYFCNTKESYIYLKDAIENIGKDNTLILCKDIRKKIESHISEFELQWKKICYEERAKNDTTSCKIEEIEITKIRDDMSGERYIGLIAPMNREANALLFARKSLK